MGKVTRVIVDLDTKRAHDDAFLICLNEDCEHEDDVTLPRRVNASSDRRCPRCGGEYFLHIVDHEIYYEVLIHRPGRKKRKR
jgi:hypothetical protein